MAWLLGAGMLASSIAAGIGLYRTVVMPSVGLAARCLRYLRGRSTLEDVATPQRTPLLWVGPE
eukprot:5472953-Lingulodinium_polyedra.AAC.1